VGKFVSFIKRPNRLPKVFQL